MGIEQELRAISQPVETPYIKMASASDCLIEHNPWGSVSRGTPYKLEVFSDISGKSPHGGWKWSVPFSNDVSLFPEIGTGQKPPPWWIVNTNKDLPKLVGPNIPFLGMIHCDYAIRSEGTGKYNTAFDLWFTNSPDGDEKDIALEMMVWLSSQGEPSPAGSQQGITNAEYSLWVANPGAGWTQPWMYAAYVSKALQTDGRMYLGLLMGDLFSRGYFDRPLWLRYIGLGNEIWWGDGQVIIPQFKVGGLKGEGT